MTTRVINVRGRIHEYGPRLELAPKDIVYVGLLQPLSGWTPTRRRDGTRAEVLAELADDGYPTP